MPFFTLFTPTFNRKNELHRLYNSLINSYDFDFEWLIVDDGSSDDTRSFIDYLISIESRFIIRYFYQSNQGKPSAFNLGLKNANGIFFGVIDSDDTLLPTSLNLIKSLVKKYNILESDSITTISGLCIDVKGRIIGQQFSENMIIDSWNDISNNKFIGEKWGMHKTMILKKYQYPVFQDEKYIPESYIWDKLSRDGNKVLCINEALRIYFINSNNSITKNLMKLRLENPKSFCVFYKQKFLLTDQFHKKTTYLLKYIFTSFFILYNKLFK
jgi:glycosyltransferase involved in cell wall biosynthesis